MGKSRTRRRDNHPRQQNRIHPIKVESMQVNGKNIKKISKGQNVAVHIKEKVRPNDAVYKRINKDETK